MSAQTLPPVAGLTPHSGSMQLLDVVLEHSPDHTVCRVDPGRSGLLANSEGRIPVWVGLEYMAQCAAVHGGLVARANGEKLRPGLFLGSRRVRFGVQALPVCSLEVEVRHHRGERGLVVFDGCVRDPAGGPTLVEGRLNIYIAERWEDLLEELGHEHAEQ